MHVEMYIHKCLVLHPFVSGVFALTPLTNLPIYTLLNLHALIFSSVRFGWFISICVRLPFLWEYHYDQFFRNATWA